MADGRTMRNEVACGSGGLRCSYVRISTLQFLSHFFISATGWSIACSCSGMDLLEGVCAACGREGLGLEAKRCSRELLFVYGSASVNRRFHSIGNNTCNCSIGPLEDWTDTMHSPTFCIRSPSLSSVSSHRMQVRHLLQRGLSKGRLGRPQEDLQGPQRRQGAAAPPSRPHERGRYARADDLGTVRHGRRLQGNLSSVPCHQAGC